MGTTKVKVIDLSSDQPEVKASRKSAARLAKSSTNVETKQARLDESSAKSKMRPAINTDEGKRTTTETKKRTPIATEEKPLESAGTLKVDTKAAPVPSSKHKNGAKYQKAKEQIDSEKIYGVKEAIGLLPKTNFVKFDASVEVHFNVTQKNVRGQVSFPHTTGPKKEKKYLVFVDKLKNAGDKNVILATDATIEELVSGKLKPGRDFDGVVASPKYMVQIAKVAKILGPAGMMPNPKNGTISEDPEKIISSGQSDAIEFRSDPMAPIVHLKIGKLSNKPEELEDNLKAIVAAVGSSRVKKATLTSTMSPGIKFDVNQF